jgi:hypothetical protein
MKLLIATFLGLMSLIGCATLVQSKDSSIYSKVDLLSLDSTKEVTFATLGQPHQCEKTADTETCTYNMPYKNTSLPLIELTFNSSGRLTGKYMILNPAILQLDLEKLKKRYPEAQFVKGEATYATSNHSYSTDHFIEDESKGLRVEYKPILSNEVQSIYWYTPTASTHRSGASQN